MVIDVKTAFADHNVAGLQAPHASRTVSSPGLHVAIADMEVDEGIVTTGIIRVVNMLYVREAKPGHGGKAEMGYRCWEGEMMGGGGGGGAWRGGGGCHLGG
jgi:hypothetical protein